MDLQTLLKTVSAKMGVLELTTKSTERSIIKGDKLECERKLSATEGKLNEIHELQLKVQEEKLLAGEDTVEKWGDELLEMLETYEETVKKAANFLHSEKQKERDDNISYERDKRESEFSKELGQEKKLYETKLKLREEYEDRLLSGTSAQQQQGLRVKLPPLVVSKFEGSVTDFLIRFWSTFCEEIDKTSIPSTSKFSYLKELLSPKIRSLIEGLPFSSEGYERAKAILKSKYGNTSEIVNEHINMIMNLPIISGSHPFRIYEFYENLVRHIQALETMGKLSSVNGYTRAILDRLPGIRADLVRNDDEDAFVKSEHFVDNLPDIIKMYF